MLLTSAAQGAGVPVGKGDTVGTQGQAQVESLSLEHVQAQRDRSEADVPPTTPTAEQPGAGGGGGKWGAGAPQESGSWCPGFSQGCTVTQNVALSREPSPVCGERSGLLSRSRAQLWG